MVLAEAAGEVVTRDQFIDRVWDGRIVTDEVLSRCISVLRTSLGDDSREPSYIQTVPKIGYRLIAAVEPLAPGLPGTDGAATGAAARTAARESPLNRMTVRLGLALLVVALVVLGWHLRRDAPVAPATAARPSSLVVLPFANHSPGEGEDYFSDGLTEELIDRLARVPGLRHAHGSCACAERRWSGARRCTPSRRPPGPRHGRSSSRAMP